MNAVCVCVICMTVPAEARKECEALEPEWVTDDREPPDMGVRN